MQFSFRTNSLHCQFLILAGLFLLTISANACPFRLADSTASYDFTSTELDTNASLEISAGYYIFQMAFDFESRTYTGNTTIQIRNASGAALDEIILDAASNLLTIESISGFPGGEPDWTHQNNHLIIDYNLGAREAVEAEISYTAIPGTVNGPFGGMGLWMSGDYAYTFSFPDGAHAWSPVIDNPGAKAPVTWELTTPEGITGVANGVLTDSMAVEEGTFTRWEEPNPVCTSEMGLALGPYVMLIGQDEPFSIRYYVYPEDEADAIHDFARIPECIAMFEEVFGHEYPFDELKIVECGVFGGSGGQEHQTMISLGHNMITGNRAYEDIVMHEIAHQWFADYITPVNWDHFWLNEGFAVWSEALWHEHLDDFDAYLDKIRSDRNAYIGWEGAGHNQALVNSDYNTTMNSPLPYERGCVALHQVRMHSSLEAMTSAIGSYLNDNAVGHVSSEVLRDAFAVELGELLDVDEYFEQWVFRGELPLIHWTVTGTPPRFYANQVIGQVNSPSHGLPYNNIMVSISDGEQTISEIWQDGSEGFEHELGDGFDVDNIQLYPGYEVLARTVRRNDLDNALLKIKYDIREESGRHDKVIQQDETAQIVFSIANAGLPLETVDWNIRVDQQNRLSWNSLQGNIPEIEFMQQETEQILLQITGNNIGEAAYADVEMRLVSANFDETFTFRIPTGRPEILLLQDGAPAAIDTIGSVLTRDGIVWSTPDTPLSLLPGDMFEATAVMLEVDGRYAETIFTADDDSLLNWFTFDGNGSISGEYIHLAYADADPSWNGGLAGEWFEIVQAPAIVGIDNDPIADGRVAVPVNQSGITNCTQCCGGPQIFFTPTNDELGARFSLGWQVVGYGFSMAKLRNGPPATLTRDELILRTAYYLLGREYTDVAELNSVQPLTFDLGSYPNPFNPTANIWVTLPSRGSLTLEVYDILGRQVEILSNNQLHSGGKHQFKWEAEGFSSGLYFLRATTGTTIRTNKLLLMK
ncbi:T9SS type A sorting domain-containing protein [bacterium]|nr:T9SS type A sorting domain-containing protein [bacterium]